MIEPIFLHIFTDIFFNIFGLFFVTLWKFFCHFVQIFLSLCANFFVTPCNKEFYLKFGFFYQNLHLNFCLRSLDLWFKVPTKIIFLFIEKLYYLIFKALIFILYVKDEVNARCIPIHIKNSALICLSYIKSSGTFLDCISITNGSQNRN